MEKKNKEQRGISKQIKVLIIGGIVLFFGAYFIYTLSKLGIFKSKQPQASTVISKNVLFELPKLYVFDETLYLNQFPDTVRVHHPYLIVVQPETRSSKIYNLETKKVEKEVKNDIPLDYWKGDTLYNWHGVTTFYNSKNLGLRCDIGFIKSVNEILCVIPKAKDPLDNKLISIDPQTGKKHNLYSSQNLFTIVSFSIRQLYIL